MWIIVRLSKKKKRGQAALFFDEPATSAGGSGDLALKLR
jgi:hypothetical protein